MCLSLIFDYSILFRVKDWYILNYNAYIFVPKWNKYAYVFNLKYYIWIFKLL